MMVHHIIYKGYWDMSNPEHIDIERLTFFNKQKDIGTQFDRIINCGKINVFPSPQNEHVPLSLG